MPHRPDPDGEHPRATGRGTSQHDVIAWLSRPAAYGPGVTTVERIETHASIIFLTDTRAYKLKRAVRYDYLDYSTLARRRSCCVAELRLNRRTAPTLYRGLRSVTADGDGTFQLDGGGRVVDWLVEMNRFEADTQLDRLAERRALDLELMPKLAQAVGRLHAIAEWRFDHGGLDGMTHVIEGNVSGFREYGGDWLDPVRAARITTGSRALVRRHASRLETRRLAGFVRHCHGDLHLGNVCLLEGEPTLFDGVEFNPAIACIDVMYDLAFLLMDLVHRGLARHATEVMNGYLDRTDDLAGLALLPLFLSTRAAVRAKTSATAATVQTSEERAHTLRDDARRYLTLAETLMTPAAPRLVAVGGWSGSGKTTLARHLAPTLPPAPGARVLRSDVVRKRLMGVPVDTRLGQDGYTRGVTREVYRSLAERAGVALEAGHSVIVDAVCGDALERAILTDVARAHDVPFIGLWLEAPHATLASRLERRRHDASDATPRVAARQREQQTVPASWIRIDASGDPEGVASSAERALVDNR